MLSFWLSLSSEGEKKGDNLGGVGEYANGHSAEKKSSLLSFQNPDFLDKKAAETKSTVLTVRFTRNNKLAPFAPMERQLSGFWYIHNALDALDL